MESDYEIHKKSAAEGAFFICRGLISGATGPCYSTRFLAASKAFSIPEASFPPAVAKNGCPPPPPWMCFASSRTMPPAFILPDETKVVAYGDGQGWFSSGTRSNHSEEWSLLFLQLESDVFNSGSIQWQFTNEGVDAISRDQILGKVGFCGCSFLVFEGFHLFLKSSMLCQYILQGFTNICR